MGVVLTPRTPQVRIFQALGTTVTVENDVLFIFLTWNHDKGNRKATISRLFHCSRNALQVTLDFVDISL